MGPPIIIHFKIGFSNKPTIFGTPMTMENPMTFRVFFGWGFKPWPCTLWQTYKKRWNISMFLLGKSTISTGPFSVANYI